MLTLWYREQLHDVWPQVYSVYRELCIIEAWCVMYRNVRNISLIQEWMHEENVDSDRAHTVCEEMSAVIRDSATRASSLELGRPARIVALIKSKMPYTNILMIMDYRRVERCTEGIDHELPDPCPASFDTYQSCIGSRYRVYCAKRAGVITAPLPDGYVVITAPFEDDPRLEWLVKVDI